MLRAFRFDIRGPRAKDQLRRRKHTMRLGALLGSALLTIGIHVSGALAQDATPGEKLPTMTEFKQLSAAYFGIEYIAKDKGFFEKYNLDVEFISTATLGGAGLPAVVAGHIQTIHGIGVPAAVQGFAGGAKVTAVYATSTSEHGDFRLLTRTGDEINSAQDLIGKTVAINNPGTYAEVALQAYLLRNNVPYDKVRRISVPMPSMCQALLSGQVDAVMPLSLFYVPCQKENPDTISVLMNDVEGIPEAAKLYTVYIFSDSFIEANAAVVRAFIAAMNDASDFVRSNPDEAKSIIAKRTGIKEENILVHELAPGGCIDMEAADGWVKLLMRLDVVKDGAISSGGWATNAYNPRCAS